MHTLRSTSPGTMKGTLGRTFQGTTKCNVLRALTDTPQEKCCDKVYPKLCLHGEFLPNHRVQNAS